MSDKPFEIPGSVRDMAEQSVNQAKSAYDQFMEASRQAQQMVEQSSGAMLTSAKEIQKKAAHYTESNMKAAFDLADKLVKANDIREAMEIQSTFARQQMENYAKQAQELTTLMAEAATKNKDQ